MLKADLEAEGGLWVDKGEFIKLFGGPDLIVWVVRFELLRVTDGCQSELYHSVSPLFKQPDSLCSHTDAR